MAALLGILHEAQLTGDWRRMKGCRRCGYAFYDRSKNRSAAWCAMSICGVLPAPREDVLTTGRVSVAATFAAAAALPVLLGGDSAALEHAVLAAAYVVMALGLNIVVGFAGLLDLGYVAFFAIGAHTAAYFGSAFWGIHLDFLAVLVIAVVATTAAGVLIGLPTLRLRGAYVGIVTLAFGEIIGQVTSKVLYDVPGRSGGLRKDHAS